MIRLLLASALNLLAVSAIAQDLPPAISPTQVAEDLVLSTTMQAHANRGYAKRGGATARQREACAQKSRFRAELGPGDPKVRRLYSLCRGVGL